MEGTRDESTATDTAAVENPAFEKASHEYLGRWNRLISSTNWEKGRIISEWREALLAAGAPVATCSDEVWSRQVGSVTPQHTGRLRRVYQRFASAREAYPGLFWSHFQAALDWDDAEMWLEGAVQNGWSIAQMQGERSRTLGALIEENVEASAIEMDEDSVEVPCENPHESASSHFDAAAAIDTEDAAEMSSEPSDISTPFDAADSVSDVPLPVRPFENLPQLPADLRDAFDSFKLAIIHHRISQWQEVSLPDVLATLDALRQLAMAPVEAA